MSPNGNSRRGLLDAGGVLSIIGVVVELVGGGVILVIVRRIMIGGAVAVYSAYSLDARP